MHRAAAQAEDVGLVGWMIGKPKGRAGAACAGPVQRTSLSAVMRIITKFPALIWVLAFVWTLNVGNKWIFLLLCVLLPITVWLEFLLERVMNQSSEP
jgi:hypothetical protein